jgi:hypothetical protein
VGVLVDELKACNTVQHVAINGTVSKTGKFRETEVPPS